MTARTRTADAGLVSDPRAGVLGADAVKIYFGAAPPATVSLHRLLDHGTPDYLSLAQFAGHRSRAECWVGRAGFVRVNFATSRAILPQIILRLTGSGRNSCECGSVESRSRSWKEIND